MDILRLYEVHLPVSNIRQSIPFYEKIGFSIDCIKDERAYLSIHNGDNLLVLHECDEANEAYHPAMRQIGLQISEEQMETIIETLASKEIEPRIAFGFNPKEPHVVALNDQAHARLHVDDPDGNCIAFISKLTNPSQFNVRMYLSEWQDIHAPFQPKR